MNEPTRRPAPPAIFGNPFRSLQDEMDRLLHAFSMPQGAWSALPAGNGTFGLKVDIGETDTDIQIKADVPGIAEDDLEVTLEDDVLRIRAEKRSETEKDDKTWRVVERSHGMFERAIRMPRGIDPDAVEAHFEKGVLTVTVPKPAEAGAAGRRISVKTMT